MQDKTTQEETFFVIVYFPTPKVLEEFFKNYSRTFEINLQEFIRILANYKIIRKTCLEKF